MLPRGGAKKLVENERMAFNRLRSQERRYREKTEQFQNEMKESEILEGSAAYVIKPPRAVMDEGPRAIRIPDALKKLSGPEEIEGQEGDGPQEKRGDVRSPDTNDERLLTPMAGSFTPQPIEPVSTLTKKEGLSSKRGSEHQAFADVAEAPVPAWRNALNSFEPGPNYRPASPNQQPRYFGPMGKGRVEGKPPMPSKATLLEGLRLADRRPTERIGANFSPYAFDLSPARIRELSRLSVKEQRTYYDVRKAELESTEESTESLGRPAKKIRSGFLPLELFDGSEHEMHTPEEWLATAAPDSEGVSAKSKYYTGKGELEFTPCWVTDYDPEESLFTIVWKHDGKGKRVKRLNLCFDDEDMNVFLERIKQAQTLRTQMEAKLRYFLYIDDLDDDEVLPPSDSEVERILRLVAAEFPANLVGEVDLMIDHLRVNHVRALKQAVFDYCYLDQRFRRKVELLSVAEPDKEPPVPEFGLIQLPEWDFMGMQDKIQEDLFTATAAYFKAVSEVLDLKMDSLDTKCLVDIPPLPGEEPTHREFLAAAALDVGDIPTMLAPLNLPCDLEEWVERERIHYTNVKRELTEIWIKAIAQGVQNSLEEHVDFYSNDFDAYANSRIKRFLKMVNLLIADQLKEFIENSAEQLTKYLERYNIDKDFDYSKCNKFILDIPFDTLPLFKIDLVVHDDVVQYSPSLDEIEDSVLNVFGTVQRASHDVPMIDSIVMPMLNMQSVMYSCVHGTEAWVIDIKKRIRDVFEANLKGPKQLIDAYQKFEYLSGTSLDEYKDKWAVTEEDVADDLKKVEEGREIIAQQELEEAENAETSSSSSLEEEEEEPRELTDQEVASRLGLRIRVVPTQDQLQTEVASLFDAMETIRQISPMKVPFPMFVVDCSRMKHALEKQIGLLSDVILGAILTRAKEISSNIIKEYQSIRQQLRREPNTPEELTELKNYIGKLEQTFNRLATEQAGIDKIHSVLGQFRYTMDSDAVALYWEGKSWPAKVTTIVDENEYRLDEEARHFQEDLRAEAEGELETLDKISFQVDQFVKFGDVDMAGEYYDRVVEIRAKIAKANHDIELLNSREVLFGWTPTAYPQLAAIDKTFVPFESLWSIAAEFTREFPLWVEGPFIELVPDTVNQNMSQWSKALYKLAKTFRDNPMPRDLANGLRDKIEDFKKHLPIIVALRNPGLRDRHWEKLSEEIGFQLRPEPDLTLQKMLDLGLSKFEETMSNISEYASKEYSLERALDKMGGEWKGISFEIVPYRETGTFVLRATDDILQLLDDHIVLTQTIRGSPFIKPFEKRAKEWEVRLLLVQDILDEWLNCQRAWVYLEPIFGSEDIMRQMPVEGRRFQAVDQFWRKTMEESTRNPNVMQVCVKENFLERFTAANERLEVIQKGLNDYLETKRLAFPRFFFLSSDELLAILSQVRDPRAVQPHLRKCFEGVNELSMKEIGSGQVEIDTMISAQKEKVKLDVAIRPTGQVEDWLLEVESVMKSSIRTLTAESLAAYTREPRKKWMLDWCAQNILCVNQIMWTKEVEEAIRENGLQGLKDYDKKLAGQLGELVQVVRGKLKSLDRITLGALATIDVHNRDTVTNMVKQGVASVDEFAWTSQLRYYWTDGTVKVKQVNAMVPYGYEYLGNTFRLVITPLTDRCYMTLMGALHLNLGGAPAGPAGTGKTETTKDLAKALAKQCVVFNCTDGLNHQAMGKFFKGLASSGAWACFDEFNRIDVEVLSVVAQQILTIQRASMEKLEKFVFEGTELRLNAGCAVFITMNPGYAGRTELPDNLKALFRPVAMMVPDYAMIAEIVLFSQGFEDARNLAVKLAQSFRLASEQLSSQDHYDFGMRAVKTVLTAAGQLKRRYTKEMEDLLVLRALCDVNVPKFLAHDIPLFLGIIKDLFPGLEQPVPDYGGLLDALRTAAESRNLLPTENFIKKCTQLYETVVVRHGLMVVGETMAGKSEVIKTLSRAMTALSKPEGEGEDEATDKKEKEKKESKKEGSSSSSLVWKPVKRHYLNPKAITSGQLYGMFDPVSNEWTDGIAAELVRKAAQDTSEQLHWLCFDGPVDAVWIEDMNTVLDDNKKLCLSSGEIIQLTDRMTMMFEVADLAVASPATVSRCGMVYMEPAQLGWRALVQSWLKKLPSWMSTHLDTLDQLFEWLADPCLGFVRDELKETVPTTEMWLIRSLLNLFSSLAVNYADLTAEDLEELDNKKKNPMGFGDDEEDEVKKPPTGRDLDTFVTSAFLFSLIWSAGATSDLKGRAQFDLFLRKKLSETDKEKAVKIVVGIPERGTVYDYLFDVDMIKWRHWMDIAPELQIADNARFHEIFVPTVDSVRYDYLLQKLVKNQVPVLFTGPTGTGKTAIMAKAVLDCFGDKNKYTPVMMNFSARTSANQSQDIIDGKLDKRRKGVFGPPLGKRCIVMVDDLNMPQKEEYGAQPPIELLRQWMDYGGWYDRKLNTMRDIVDVGFCASMGPPGGGRTHVTPRYLRHFNLFSFTEIENSTMKTIFGSILDWYLSQDFTMGIKKLKDPIIDATIDIYDTISRELLPTPAKSHYTFNLRDLGKVFQGMLNATPERFGEVNQMLRLWVHEADRVFRDRLISRDDRMWFDTAIRRILKEQFKVKNVEDVIDPSKPLWFADFLVPGADKRYYEEVEDMGKIHEVVSEYLEDYNAMTSKVMSLVLFNYAIDHVVRIARVLRSPFGNALLVGVGGSGRQSLTRLASFMAECELFQIEISKAYGFVEWREDLRTVFRKAGLESKQIVFLFSDSQIKDEAFLEDINNILNTGEIPNIWPPDELQQIMEGVSKDAQAAGKGDTRNDIFSFFVERCKENIHVVLAMSPIGDAFRMRLRQFPSLVNCCTIDWFTPWPEEGLRSVADHFLKGIEMPEEVYKGVVDQCVEIHTSVQHLADRYLSEVRRHCYVTPTSYLELINTFKQTLGERREFVSTAVKRYSNGLKKLGETAEAVAVMKKEQEALKPVLVQTTKDTEELMKQIEVDQKVADEAKAKVGVEEQAAAKNADEAGAIKAECQADLAEALPALAAAIKALRTLKKSDIVEVKSMKRPPEMVKTVMESVCIMQGLSPKMESDPKMPGKKIANYWDTTRTMLANSKFLQTLIDYDKDNIPESIIAKIQVYINMDNYTQKEVAKVSIAAAGLCAWVRAMDSYHRINRVVKPKKEKLKVAQAQLAAAEASLTEKRAALKVITDRVEDLMAKYAVAVTKKEDLEVQYETCLKRLDRAQKLLGGLGGEGERWAETEKTLQIEYGNLVGDCLLSAGIIGYLGPFSSQYRDEAVTGWTEKMKEKDIPTGENYALSKVLGSPVKIRDWNLQGLPTDRLSIDNAIVMDKSRRWPLLIDPQGQANRWIKNSMKEKQLKLIKQTDQNFMRSLENAIQFGNPVLLENVGEELDPALEPLLLKQTFMEGNVEMIKLGENTLEWQPDFKFFITSKLPNPHYPPEISTKVTLLNFTITPSGLEDQLLGIAVAKERPELEEEKNKLLLESAENKRQLKEIEDKILELMAASEGNILDDEVLINTLAQSKRTSAEIETRVAAAAITEEKIDQARARYEVVAERAALMFFVISDLSVIDPMYQYSLAWYIQLFLQSIDRAPLSDNLEKRLQNLNSTFTYALYQNVCRSLFEKDKLLFSFVLCYGIMMKAGTIDALEYRYFVGGAVSLEENQLPNPDPSWIEDRAWKELCDLARVSPVFAELPANFTKRTKQWNKWFNSAVPHKAKMPDPFKESLNDFQKLCVVKAILPEKTVPGIQDFVGANLGNKFVDIPAFSLAKAFEDSTPCTPLVFILSPGADPIASVLKFGQELGFAKKTGIISLGQGQGPIAQKMIEDGVDRGLWVVLQNCHLAPSWMPDLERITDNITPGRVHSDFRLWLTSMPSPKFPVSVLQNGVKMTIEPPKGIRANLLKNYTNFDRDWFGDIKQNKPKWKKMLFGLCFFHALIQERRKFGPLGWNISYEFTDSDLQMCVRQLKMFLEENAHVPYAALKYLAGQANYGGRVTDDWDRRTIMCILDDFYLPEILKKDYVFSLDGTYYAPEDGPLNSYLEYIRSLPLNETPEVFGLHANADITFARKELSVMVGSILNTLPKTGGGSGVSMDEVVEGVAKDILEKMPDVFNTREIMEKHPQSYKDSMATVLLQDVGRFNRLIAVVRSSLAGIRKAIKGLVVMSAEYEKVCVSMFDGRVPEMWAAKAYPSMKPLGSWVQDLHARLAFLQKWINNGVPNVFWISGFFFPQAFLTGTKQNFARRYQIPIDTIDFDFQVMRGPQEHPPGDGVYIHGLYVQGARWDEDRWALAESKPRELFCEMPIIWVKPMREAEIKRDRLTYACPVYKTSQRAGTLSTTGHSTNYVLEIALPSENPESFWVKRGVAMLTGLDD